MTNNKAVTEMQLEDPNEESEEYLFQLEDFLSPIDLPSESSAIPLDRPKGYGDLSLDPSIPIKRKWKADPPAPLTEAEKKELDDWVKRALEDSPLTD